MNLYNLHKDPKSLHKHKEAHDVIPELIQHVLDNRQALSKKQIETISKDAKLAYFYAARVLKKRWPMGEKVIASTPDTARRYAEEIISGKWPEGEKAIATKPMQSYAYALDVLKGKFPAGEKAIATDDYYTKEYNNYLIDKGYSENELI